MRVSIKVVAGSALGRSWEFTGRDRFLVGSADDSSLCLAGDEAMSRHHCIIEIDPPHLLLRDLSSSSGTRVNGSAAGEHHLVHGDRIQVGATELEIALSEHDSPPSGIDATVLSEGLAATLALGEHDPVRCNICGYAPPDEPPRLRRDRITYFCPVCRPGLMEQTPSLAGYRFVRMLGKGAMGAVFLAVEDGPEQRSFAVKQILPRGPMSEDSRRCFERETRAHARLDHPHIVHLHDFKEATPGVFSLIMEYVEGPSADKLLADGPLDVARAVDIVAQALEGLGHAHACGLIHRDVKDGNILVGHEPGGQTWVKLADFGLARSLEESGGAGATLGGTVPYMPPEQVTHYREVEARADLYAMGATLYRLLTGHFPHEFPTGCNGLLVVLEQPIVPLAQRRADVPAALAAAVEKALERDPARRHHDAADMRRAILAAAA